MASLGNAHYSSTHVGLRGTATDLLSVPWVPNILGYAQGASNDKGKGIPGTPTSGAAAMPTTGQIWPTGWLNPTVAPMVRTTATITTASLAPTSAESGTVTLAKSYRLLSITTSRPARVRLYTTPTKRDADTARAVGDMPAGDHGLLFEFITITGALSTDLTPTIDGFDGKTTPDGIIAYRVTNMDAATGTVVTNLAWLRTE